MEAFAWIGQIIETLGKFIPRLTIVKATMGGVKWRSGKTVKPMMPGLHVYWPIVTEIELIVTARQTLNLPTQVLMTKDRQKVVVGTVVVYRIKDIVQAIGEKNWDVDTTISDITKTAIVSEIAKLTLDELLAGVVDESVNNRLTKSSATWAPSIRGACTTLLRNGFRRLQSVQAAGHHGWPYSALRGLSPLIPTRNGHAEQSLCVTNWLKVGARGSMHLLTIWTEPPDNTAPINRRWQNCHSGETGAGSWHPAHVAVDLGRLALGELTIVPSPLNLRRQGAVGQRLTDQAITAGSVARRRRST
jgi:hypothetical protein